jgi:hypothetical protein
LDAAQSPEAAPEELVTEQSGHFASEHGLKTGEVFSKACPKGALRRSKNFGPHIGTGRHF